MKKLSFVLTMILSASLACGQTVAPASAGPAPTGLAVGSGNYFSPIVADLEKAIAFYSAIGFQFQGEPANADANPQLRAMFGLPDARLRYQIGRAPSIAGGVEIIEVSRANGQPVTRAVQDPGAVTLVATVRDLDGAFARVKQLGAPVVTRSNRPIQVGSVGRMVVVQDPAGHFVEIVQPDKLTEAQAAATGNVVGVRVRFTVSDVDRALKLYRDALGFHELAPVGQYNGDAAVLDALGLSAGQYRVGQLQVPTSGLQFTLIDFKGVERATKLAGIKDPGSTRIQLRVADIDAAVTALSKAGGAFISTGGKPLDLPAGANALKVGIVRDPDNLFLVLINAPPAAPR
jgi:catechol 2,3-dioxygenase-like lactoylglutathione lyase family enzyme